MPVFLKYRMDAMPERVQDTADALLQWTRWHCSVQVRCRDWGQLSHRREQLHTETGSSSLGSTNC